MNLFAEFNLWNIPAPVALASVAVLGYLMGRRGRQAVETLQGQARRELKRAQSVAKQLEDIADLVRRNLAQHHSAVARFKDRIVSLSDASDSAAARQLCAEAEEILGPTMRLAAQISNAYDEIRRQGNQLMSFTEVRTDALTGVSNRRALDESLAGLFAMKNRYDVPFAVAMFDLDHFKKINDTQGHLGGDRVLQDVARIIDECARETDMVARYGGEEFVVIMPQTELQGAMNYAERVRQLVEERTTLTISGGVAAATGGEDPQSLLGRADAALYDAKAAGRNRVFQHDGENSRPTSDGAAIAVA